MTGALSLGAARLLPSAVPASVSTGASRVHAPSPLRVPSPSPCAGRVHAPCVSPRPSQQMSTIQNLRKSLVRNWEPVCSLVGGALSGAEFAPFPSPLPPASSRGWAGPQPASSSLVFSQSFVPKQCCPLLSIQPSLAGVGCERLGYFSAGSCF